IPTSPLSLHDALPISNLPMLAISEIYYGIPNAGREHLKEALDLATRIGDMRNELLIYLCYCEGYLIQGQYDDARRCATRAIDLADRKSTRLNSSHVKI